MTFCNQFSFICRSKDKYAPSSSVTKEYIADMPFPFLLLLPYSLNEPHRDKTNNMTVRPANIQISLGIRPVWSESWLCAQWVAKNPRFLHADSEDSDQTGRMPRLIWVFAGRTCHFVGSVMRRLKSSSTIQNPAFAVLHKNYRLL